MEEEMQIDMGVAGVRGNVRKGKNGVFDMI